MKTLEDIKQNGIELNTIYWGDCLEVLKQLPDECVDTIITSPPYWGLRDYGFEGQIGLEPTLDEYLEKLFKITAELKRVLKKSGVIFWNHGDCYGSHSIGQGNVGGIEGKRMKENEGYKNSIKGQSLNKLNSIPDKCLALQNWRLILRMIDEQGWVLRNVIIWHKPNAMPSSVKDRFSNRYEPVFMLVKNKKYWFDLDAVRIPATTLENRPYGVVREREFGYNTGFLEARKGRGSNNPALRNRNFMPIKNKFNYRVRDAEKKSAQCPQFKATKEEIERYKKETGKIRGGGANTNLPWNPLTGGKIYKTSIPQSQAESFGSPRARYWRNVDPRGNDKGGPESWRVFKEDNPNFTNPLGKNPGDVWLIPTQPCPREFRGVHFAVFPEKLVEPMILAGCPKNGIVLDPFCGLGTTCVVAKKLGRNYIGIDKGEIYCQIAEKRLASIPQSLL